MQFFEAIQTSCAGPGDSLEDVCLKNFEVTKYQNHGHDGHELKHGSMVLLTDFTVVGQWFYV